MLIICAIFKVFQDNKVSLSQIVDVRPVSVVSGKQFAEISNMSSPNSATDIKKNSGSSVNSNQSLSKSNLDISLKSQESDMYNNNYLNVIANMIEQNKSYINMFSAPSGVRSEVVFRVKLDKMGHLSSYELVKASGYRFFDKAATKILKISAPFPAPPLSNNSVVAEITIPIVFDTIS